MIGEKTGHTLCYHPPGSGRLVLPPSRAYRPMIGPLETGVLPELLMNRRLERDDQALDLPRQLVGVANRPARAVGQGLQTAFLCSARRSCSRSCAKCRTRDRPRSSLRRPAAERRTAGAPPSPNTPSTASTPPPERGKVLPMCPVRSVTYVSGRSTNELSGCQARLRILSTAFRAGFSSGCRQGFAAGGRR